MSVWSEENLRALVDARGAETLTLELKAELPGRSDRDRAEFLKDVSALANASGGYILFGISEQDGLASSFSGLRMSNADGEIRRLSQILEGGIEPRLSGAEFSVASLDVGDVLVVHVPESFDSPHRYVFNNHSKFVQRMGTHTSELSYDQLRAAFDRSSNRLNLIRTHWQQELSLEGIWKPILSGPVCIVRLSPLLSAEDRQVVDPKVAYQHWSHLIFPGWGGGSASFNYQGLAVYPSRDDEVPALTQIYRNGAVTAFRTGKLLIDNRPLIPSVTVGDFFVDAGKRLINFARHIGIAGSALLQMGIVRLSGYSFAVRDIYGFDENLEAGVDRILLPEFWIENLSEIESVDQLVRPGLDLLWQSFGRAECPLFNADGQWDPRSR